jgi:hypothetical protein
MASGLSKEAMAAQLPMSHIAIDHFNMSETEKGRAGRPSLVGAAEKFLSLQGDPQRK